MLQRLGGLAEQVKIVDFGIAKVKQSVIAPSTVTGSATAGTIIYMSPEQLRARRVGAPSDIYALGVIAYEMVTGRRPFNPETITNLSEMQREGVRVKPADLRPSLSEEAQAIILKALAFEPADRYQDAGEFGDALSRALMNEDEETLRLGRPAEISRTQPSPTVPHDAATGPRSEKTMPGHFEPSQPPFFRQPLDSSASRPKTSHFSISLNTPWLKFAISFVFLVTVVTAFYGYLSLRSSNVPTADMPASSNRASNAGPLTASAPAERLLVYSLTVQKFHDGKSYDQPFETSGQEIFENGWKFQMNISSPEGGYLYLLNEGPAANGATTFNVLFPEPKTNNGSPRVMADQKLHTAWMRFDQHQGTEKFWIVWSASPVKELDDVTGVVNAQQRGEISDPNQAKAVRTFLEQHSSPKPEVTKDSTKKQTTVKGRGDVIVNFVELEHH